MSVAPRRPALSILLLLVVSTPLLAQPPQEGPAERAGGRAGFDRGPGGFGPMNREDLKLVDQFDENDDGWLNLDERKATRASVEQRRSQQGRRGPGGGRRGPGGPFGNQQPAEPGRKVSPDEVEQFPTAELYDNTVLRTLFLDFESDDWEQELEAFKGTDVEVPATVTVDGTVYPNVGVHFRGNSSYMMVSRGKKRSLNLSFDFLNRKQWLYGYKTLNLLNCAGDPSMMSAVLYAHIGRQYVPTPRANFVEVVINGESWGVYANVQQFDKIFLRENFQSAKGTRWKVPGSPGADGGLRYLGEELTGYQQRFDMKSHDGQKAWMALVGLCRVLNETPPDELEDQLVKVLDIDETLKFLALDVVLVSSDGYWSRASDYSLFRNTDGVFRLVPYDMNEAFSTSGGGPRGGRDRRGRRDDRRRGGGQQADDREAAGPPFGDFGTPGEFAPLDDFGPPMGFGSPDGFGPPQGFGPPPGFGPGGPGGFGHGGVDLDPLVGMENERMPLRSRLLAVPALRDEYLGYVRAIAQDALDWNELQPFVESQRALIDEAVRRDTKKLASYEEFDAAMNALRDFAEKRRAYLLDYQPPADDPE